MLYSMPAFCSEKHISIQQQLSQLETQSSGRLGIAMIDTNTNQEINYRANEYFPMRCTSKVIGVAAILKKNMHNEGLLNKKIRYTKNDLTNWAPITAKHVTDGMTIKELCAAAISYSDNTAMNLLTTELGGLVEINSFARSIGNRHFKLNHTWPGESYSSPKSMIDVSTPTAMTENLRKLALGSVLANPERKMLITWMKQNTTGNDRIRAGIPKNWIVADKTGTGLYGTTNDIAVIWPPNCAPIIITIFYSTNIKDAPNRNDVIASATRILINSYIQTDSCFNSHRTY